MKRILFFCFILLQCSQKKVEGETMDPLQFLIFMSYGSCYPAYQYTAVDSDMLDGTIRRRITTTTSSRCSQTSTSTVDVFYKKCFQGQIFQSGPNDCRGAGNAGNLWNAQLFQFCAAQDSSCELPYSGGYREANPAISPAAASCAGEIIGGKTWRLPSTMAGGMTGASSLKTLDLLSLNPDTAVGPGHPFWSRFAYSGTAASFLYYNSNGWVTISRGVKDANLLVLCATE